MKKSLIAIAAAALLAGCTTVESTQKFNRVGLGTPNEKAICQTYVEIPGYFFCGLPIVTGSPAGDGEWSFFRWNLTTENAVYLLTKEAKSHRATRVINVQVSKTYTQLLLFMLTKSTIQASGTGVCTKSAAIDRTARDYDRQP